MALAELSFEYAGEVVPADPPARGVYRPDGRRCLVRDPAAERTAADILARLGVRTGWAAGGQTLQLAPAQLPAVVRELVAAGWAVEADGKRYRPAGPITLAVSTGQDWFDLTGAADFGGRAVPFPRLLAALRRGDATVALDDGSLGLLPEDWLRQYGLFGRLGTVEGGRVRFARSQVGVLDALLAARPEVTFDRAFARARFDTCVLDESQAAKNAATETAKAVRVVRADHRLALSGTPVENHLGELVTLIDFLNPGMLERADVNGSRRSPDAETRAFLARALRPFLLRRTKSQVATDLPVKTEQTVYCDLEPAQRRLYDELRDNYRQSLLARVDAVGLGRAKVQVLWALLRLRQAACHPGLVDKRRVTESSAKLDYLLPRLAELAEGGSKVLVFSQFTSLLAIVRGRLDAAGTTYEYLDGRTRDRAERVARFQADPGCRLFLVSLKAGGVGLNLTAAGYVFLLDPWWNPAAEAQAVDRAHRIGQTKPVVDYRLIARDTVEEKVLAPQASKRALADAILGGDGRPLDDLRREDLELPCRDVVRVGVWVRPTSRTARRYVRPCVTTRSARLACLR